MAEVDGVDRVGSHGYSYSTARCYVFQVFLRFLLVTWRLQKDPL
jgi:hypothetical protein